MDGEITQQLISMLAEVPIFVVLVYWLRDVQMERNRYRDTIMSDYQRQRDHDLINSLRDESSVKED